MIYPESRMVNEDTIIGWAKDSLVNSVIQHKLYSDDSALDADIAIVHASKEYASMTIESAMDLLEDTGECTFRRSQLAAHGWLEAA
jgi:hypothetical protein